MVDGQAGALPPMAVRTLEFDKVRAMLAERCVTEIGRQLAEDIEPSPYAEQAARDLSETAEAEGFVLRNGRPPLSGAHDIRSSLRRAELGSSLNPAELLKVASVLRAARGVRRYAKPEAAGRMAAGPPAQPQAQAQANAKPQPQAQAQAQANAQPQAQAPGIVAETIASLVENHRLEQRIEGCIISEEEIADDASPALLSIRRQIRRLQESIKNRLNDIVKSPKYQKFMQDSLVTIRQDRYVIPVKQEFRQEISGLVHDMSASGATVFIEPMAVVEANNEIRQQRAKERSEIERILAELTAEACEMGPQLVLDVEGMGALDFAFAKARLSLDLGCSTPEVGAGLAIHIKKGRHPLLPKADAVPLDFWMDPGVDTVVVTGPNTGGKTVALKTVGLLTLMAQAGLNVPAAHGTTLRVFSQVYADIGDEQSIEQSLSTFSSHMRNIVRIIASSDERTLALFDEIGAGTDPAEGAALARSVLERLRQAGATSMATTHYSELKMYALETPGVTNACCEFDVATLRPTFRLLIGVPGKSNAFAISERLGLQGDVLARARSLMSQGRLEFEDALHAIEDDRRAAEGDRRAAEAARLEAEATRRDLERQRRGIDAQRESAMRESREAAKRYLAETKRDADDILAQLRLLEKERDDARRKAAETELRMRLKDRAGEVDASLAAAGGGGFGRGGARDPGRPASGGAAQGRIKKGDTVLILELNQRGTALSPPDKNGDVSVQAGILTITANVSGLELVDEQGELSSKAAKAGWGGAGAGAGASASVEPAGAGFASDSKTLGARAEIDLRGARLEDAIAQVDRYLDSAALAGLGEVSIIHGKGTGALRAGIQKFLKSHPKAASFRNGSYGEGDMGVTIVSVR